MTPLQVGIGLAAGCPASRNDANGVTALPVAMTHEQQPQCATQAEKDKAIFVFGMVRVIDQLGPFGG